MTILKQYAIKLKFVQDTPGELRGQKKPMLKGNADLAIKHNNKPRLSGNDPLRGNIAEGKYPRSYKTSEKK